MKFGKESGIALMLSAALMAGCGDEQKPKTKEASQPTTPAPVGEAPTVVTAEVENTDPQLKSLNDFRRVLLLGHHANFISGACVAWESRDTVAVTVNPGVAYLGDDFYFVFSRQYRTGTPPIMPMNGAFVTDENLVMALDQRSTGEMSDRQVAKEVSYDPDGQAFYTDKETGAPLMKTKIVSGSLATVDVSKVCSELNPSTAT